MPDYNKTLKSKAIDMIRGPKKRSIEGRSPGSQGLHTKTSVVDKLKSKGMDSSMSNRKKLASAFGISDYKGTAAQNKALMSEMNTAKTQSVKAQTSVGTSRGSEARKIKKV
jgi:hypothetical protein